MGQIFVAFSEYLSFKYIGEYFDFFRQYVLEYKNCNSISLQSDRNLNDFVYSQVPIKRVGPNKRVGWIFYVNFLNK